MKTYVKSLINILSAVLVALEAVSCTNTGAQIAEQRIGALQKTRAQEADYLKGLATTVKEEKRNDVWAAQKESELRSSYTADKSVPSGALKSVECGSSQCAVQLQLISGQSPKAAVEQQIAINQWIAGSQPCGYTMTTEPGTEKVPGAIRVFVNCSSK
jgi:hypothetical protein